MNYNYAHRLISVSGSMNSSDNYRGISLSNSICKLYDYVFIDLNMDYLKTDDMQFGFKDNHSTVLCTAVYIETINHYMNEGSDVYSCLIDASKAFDRVHWGKLFSILIEKKVSYIFLRLILDSYIRQKACVAWGDFRSQYFLFKNGVKQGGVLSPIFFTLYIDKLLVMLRTTGIGCHLGSAYSGALSYADDITLLCPSVRGLNEMIVLCCEYAKEYDIMFNPKKTVCIKFGSKIHNDEHVSMNGFTVQWSESVRHLGNFVDSTLSDSLDCRYKRSMFIGYVNKLMSKFGHLQPHILINLFKTYCCSFFGSSTWRLNSAGFKSCTTAWNVGVRRLLNLPNTTHTWLLGPLLDSVHMTYKLYIRDLKFIYCMKNNDNYLVSSCFEYVSNNANSILGNKIAYFREKYRIQHDFSNLKKAIKMIEQASVLSGEEKSFIDSVWSLILVKSNQYTVEGFDFAEINDMLYFLVTS